MRRLAPLAALALLAGCATSPVSFSAVAPPGQDDPFSCAMQQLAQMDYTVEDTDRESGFIRARKQTSGFGQTLLAGTASHSALVVSIFDAPDGEGQTMRVTAGGVTEDTWGFGQGSESSMNAPSDENEAEGRTVLGVCAGDDGRMETAGN